MERLALELVKNSGMSFLELNLRFEQGSWQIEHTYYLR